MDSKKLQSVTYDLLQKHFTDNKGYHLIKHILESYNDFVLRKIDHIIEGFNPVVVHHTHIPELDKFKYVLEIEMKNPVISKPMIYEKDGSTKIMTPMDARNRNFTYSGPITIDIEIRAKTLNLETGDYAVDAKTVSNVALGKMPIMVMSRYCILSTQGAAEEECRYDYGGYFVVNGNEKVIISQDRIAENKTYVFVNNKVSAYSCIAEIRSVQENRFSVPKTTTMKLSSKPNQFGRFIRINIHHIKHDIPLFILFRALGVESDHDIVDLCTLVGTEGDADTVMDELVGTIEEANNVMTQREAFEYLVRYLNINGYPKEIISNRAKKMDILREVLTYEFLPHVGTEFHKKALYLGYMANKLIRCHLKLIPYDDRDSYINKRIDTPGIQMANLFRQYYGKVIKDMKNMLQKEINSGGWKATNKLINVINKINISKVIKSTIIESGLKYGLSTGNWGIKSNKMKQGVAQVLNRLSYNATISHMRRINTPIDKTGKLIQPRKLHGTQMGVICPAETPEGVSVGLVKNLSVSGSITICSDTTNLRELLEAEGAMNLYIGAKKGSSGSIEIFAKADATRVFVNGDLIGTHNKPNELYALVKSWKMSGIINAFTGVVWNIVRGEIWICTDGGRCVRPVYVVDDGNNVLMAKKKENAQKSFSELVIDGVIEFLDVDECNNAMIAMKPDDLVKGAKGALNAISYTHLEMDPSLLMGIMAGSIPFSNHNQAPRNCYQCLWLEEDVLMADGSKKKIKDVKVGDEVVTFDNETMYTSTTKVVNQFVRETDKKMYEIETVSGRRIKATFDHLFMTNRGWQKVEDIKEGTLVGIYPNDPSVTSDVDLYTILDTPKMTSHLADLYPIRNPSLVVKKLTEIGILPLTSQSPQLPIIARLMGYLSTQPQYPPIQMVDGMHVFTCSFETVMDASMFEDDVERIGFDRVKIDARASVTHNGAIATLFACLASIGSVAPYSEVPPWVMFGSARTKREFLGGFQGGDKSTTYPYHTSFKSQIKHLFHMFDVVDNMTDTIGFRYSVSRTTDSAIMGECHKIASITQARLIKTKGPMMFVPVASKREIVTTLIADITTESPNHSFIAGDGFAVHNSSMGKQAIGIYTSNFRKRYDTLGHVLNYPQAPLVQTRVSKIVNTHKMPCGINAIVAIATYTGFNQEDSVILNQSAIDRGLFQSTYFRTYKEVLNKNHSTGEEEYFCKPDPSNTKQLKPHNYDKLTHDGFVPENKYVHTGDVLIGKCMPQKQGAEMSNKDTSLALKNNEHGFIDRNCYGDQHFTNVNGDGYNFAKVRLRNDRIPTIGDKFASRSAQKGSLGMVYQEQDMPFTKDGIRPDIIMNPHAIPSRMTIGQLMECIMGKACVNIGTFGDGTPFSDINVEDIAEVLESCGLERYGNEIMYNSRTGEQMVTDIFIGPTYYQRLKHMTADKVHSRACNGPVVMLTRQPAEGRARDGGLRLGEMEIECNWAHGIMHFLKERFMECSDNYRVFVCKKCGMMANVNPEKGIFQCKPCKNTSNFSEIRIPYACKLLFQEIQTMSIGAKFIV